MISSAILLAASFFAFALIIIQLSPSSSCVTEDKDHINPLLVSKERVGRLLRSFVFDFLTS